MGQVRHYAVEIYATGKVTPKVVNDGAERRKAHATARDLGCERRFAIGAEDYQTIAVCKVLARAGQVGPVETVRAAGTLGVVSVGHVHQHDHAVGQWRDVRPRTMPATAVAQYDCALRYHELYGRPLEAAAVD